MYRPVLAWLVTWVFRRNVGRNACRARSAPLNWPVSTAGAGILVRALAVLTQNAALWVTIRCAHVLPVLRAILSSSVK